MYLGISSVGELWTRMAETATYRVLKVVYFTSAIKVLAFIFDSDRVRFRLES